MKPKQNPAAGVPIMDAEAIRRALRRIAHEIIEGNPNLESVVLAGIPSRGVEIARRIAAFIREIEKADVDTGVIDVAMHRDDVGTRKELPVVHASKLPVPLEDRTVIIVDDVLYTGRTVRAAMDAINSFGRPARIQLAVLVDRGHRELPIRPDYVGKNLPTATREQIQVRLQETDNEPDGVYWKSNEQRKTIRGAHACSVLAKAFRLRELQVRTSYRDPGSVSAKPKPARCKRALPDSAIAAAVDVRIMTTRWTRKDLLGLRELTADEINFVLETTDAFKQVGTREIKKVPALRGKTLVNFFVEPSTRTRTSFELAAFRLSADVINISATTSSLTKGETLKDTARNLEALHADIIVLRHSSAGAPQFLASRLKASVINAGDGAHEHPTQALLDLYTIRERRGKIAGLHVAIIGDILFSRVARSNIFGLLKLGARVTLVGPSTLVPREFEKLGAEVSHKIEDVLPTADVVNLLRIQHERQRREYFPGLGEYIRLFGLTKERAKLLKPDCLIMHPGPINRGVEIDSEVADGLQSVILDQVTNGLAVRMAVLYLCGGIAT